MKKLGFGLMRLPLTVPGDTKTIDQEIVNKMVDAFMAGGFTYFDTAYGYHGQMSEGTFRKAVAERYPRERYTIADKMPLWNVKESADYQRLFDEQIERCGVEYFDYYMLHNLGSDKYPETIKLGGFKFLQKVKTEGRTKRIGFSFHDTAEVLDKILTEQPEMDFVQLQINYIDWEDDKVQSRKCYETALKHGKPVVIMEPVKGGCLASPPEEAEELFKAKNAAASPASWAIRFAASLENSMVVLSGMSTMEQLTDNVSFMRDFKPFDSDEKKLIEKVSTLIRSKIAVPCTACNYCVDDCPKKIPISRYFALYNNLRRYGLAQTVASGYRFATQEGGKPGDCISCKQCEGRCPQHIPIVEKLKEVAEAFTKGK